VFPPGLGGAHALDDAARVGTDNLLPAAGARRWGALVGGGGMRACSGGVWAALGGMAYAGGGGSQRRGESGARARVAGRRRELPGLLGAVTAVRLSHAVRQELRVNPKDCFCSVSVRYAPAPWFTR